MIVSKCAIEFLFVLKFAYENVMLTPQIELFVFQLLKEIGIGSLVEFDCYCSRVADWRCL